LRKAAKLTRTVSTIIQKQQGNQYSMLFASNNNLLAYTNSKIIVHSFVIYRDILCYGDQYRHVPFAFGYYNYHICKGKTQKSKSQENEGVFFQEKSWVVAPTVS
jgi:hypothetical protein